MNKPKKKTAEEKWVIKWQKLFSKHCMSHAQAKMLAQSLVEKAKEYGELRPQ